MQAHYSDEKLAALLAHARDGKLEYHSCCCFIGVTTATHALGMGGLYSHSHYLEALKLSGGCEADNAYCYLHMDRFPSDEVRRRIDEVRRRILIPMILAEFRRRERARQQAEWKQELVEMST